MKSYALAIAATLLFTACGTLFGDKDRMVRIESTPAGATVLLNGMPYGKTPTTVQISNLMSSNAVTLKLKDYDEVTRPIVTSVQPIAFLNLLNLVCWGVDIATGNVMKIDTKVISVDMDKKSAVIYSDHGPLTVDLFAPATCPNT